MTTRIQDTFFPESLLLLRITNTVPHISSISIIDQMMDRAWLILLYRLSVGCVCYGYGCQSPASLDSSVADVHDCTSTST